MSQLVHAIAHSISRPPLLKLHTQSVTRAAIASRCSSSFHSSSRTAAPHSSLPLQSPLADTIQPLLYTGASSHEQKARQGLSIREDDDYQQQSPEQRKQPPSSTRPHITTPSSAATDASTASSAVHAYLPADAHAYFRVPPAASSDSPTTQSSHGGGAAGVLAGQPLVNIANDLTDQFMRAVHLSEQTRFVKGVVLGVSLLAVLSLSAYLFRDSVKTTTAEQVADVAKRSLADSDVQHQVNTLSQDVVHRLLTDQAVLSTALQFTQRLLHEPGTQTALQNLLHRLLADPKTLDWGKEYSTRLVAQLTADEKVQRMVAELVKGALMQENNRETLIALLKQTVNDERSLSELRRVGSQSAKDVMNDATVQQHMTDFMKGVLADHSLQQQAGDALWSAVRYSIRPTWGKAAIIKEDNVKHGTKAASDGAPPLTRPLSAPLAAEASAGATATATERLRDAVSMPAGGAAALGASHPMPASAEVQSVSSAPTSPAATFPSSSSSSSSSASSRSARSSVSSDRSDSPSSYLPVVSAPFAVASVDEEDLTPTFTINVNPHRAQAPLS